METLAGIQFPETGKRVFPEDWKNEQEKKAQELIKRDKDLLGTGIHKGGVVAIGSGSAKIDLPEITIAYDPDGKRIEVPVLSGISVPDNASSKIIVRHKFSETEFTSPDNIPSDGPVIWLDNDYEVLARQGSLDPKDVPLREISVASGTITLGNDLRVFREVKSEQIQSITNEITKVKRSVKLVGELFHYPKHPSLCPPSASFPNLCISRLHPADSKTATLLQANWATLVPELRSQTLFFGASDAIDYTGFTPGNPTTIQLDTSGSKNTDVNDPLIELLNWMVRYHDSIDFGDSILSANWTSLNLVCSFSGSDYRIIDFDAINRTITIDYDSTSDTSAPGTIKIYPHRIRTSDANASTTAQIRKLKPETTLASAYQSGILLPFQFQGFNVSLADRAADNLGGPFSYFVGTNQSNSSPGFIVTDFVDDGAHGTPQVGKSVRSNQLGTYIYIAGGTYTP